MRLQNGGHMHCHRASSIDCAALFFSLFLYVAACCCRHHTLESLVAWHIHQCLPSDRCQQCSGQQYAAVQNTATMLPVFESARPLSMFAFYFLRLTSVACKLISRQLDVRRQHCERLASLIAFYATAVWTRRCSRHVGSCSSC
jgi:hypothetical protein